MPAAEHDASGLPRRWRGFPTLGSPRRAASFGVAQAGTAGPRGLCQSPARSPAGQRGEERHEGFPVVVSVMVLITDW